MVSFLEQKALHHLARRRHRRRPPDRLSKMVTAATTGTGSPKGRRPPMNDLCGTRSRRTELSAGSTQLPKGELNDSRRGLYPANVVRPDGDCGREVHVFGFGGLRSRGCWPFVEAGGRWWVAVRRQPLRHRRPAASRDGRRRPAARSGSGRSGRVRGRDGWRRRSHEGARTPDRSCC